MMTKYLSYRVLPMVFVALSGVLSGVFSFQPTTQQFQNRQAVKLAAESATSSMATLTESTTWTMRMNLENLPTEKGKKTGGIYVIQAKFIEEEGYEPPQGILQQFFPKDDTVDDENTENEPSASQMTVRSGRWTLSEDPNDRKDSLWYVRFCVGLLMYITFASMERRILFFSFVALV
jgi:hypothetical protein